MCREIIKFAAEVLAQEGTALIDAEPTNNGHYRLLFNIGDARHSYIIGMRMSSHRTFQNIRAGIRRKVREVKMQYQPKRG